MTCGYPDISGLVAAADRYATGDAADIATAFAWLDNDLRAGTRDGVLYSQTLSYQIGTLWPAINAVAAAYTGCLVQPYEAACEIYPPSKANCATLGIDASYGSSIVGDSNGKISDLFKGYKRSQWFYNLTRDFNVKVLANSRFDLPSWFTVAAGQNGPSQWSMNQTGNDAFGTRWQSWDATVDFNARKRRWSLKT